MKNLKRNLFVSTCSRQKVVATTLCLIVLCLFTLTNCNKFDLREDSGNNNPLSGISKDNPADSLPDNPIDTLHGTPLDPIDSLSMPPIPDDPPIEESDIYYVAGYNANCAGGYIFISNNCRDTLYAIAPQINDFFTFTSGIMQPNICGFDLFPGQYQRSYKVLMSYKAMTASEKQNALCPCTDYPILCPDFAPKYVTIVSLSK